MIPPARLGSSAGLSKPRASGDDPLWTKIITSKEG